MTQKEDSKAAIDPSFDKLVELGDGQALECVNVNGIVTIRTVDTKEPIINQEDTLKDLSDNLGDPIEVQLYGKRGNIWNVAISNMDKYAVIYDLDNPDMDTEVN